MVELTPPPRQQEGSVKVFGEYLRKPEIIHALCIHTFIHINICVHCIHLCTHYVCIIIYSIHVCSCDTVSLYVCVYICYALLCYIIKYCGTKCIILRVRLVMLVLQLCGLLDLDPLQKNLYFVEFPTEGLRPAS